MIQILHSVYIQYFFESYNFNAFFWLQLQVLAGNWAVLYL